MSSARRLVTPALAESLGAALSKRSVTVIRAGFSGFNDLLPIAEFEFLTLMTRPRLAAPPLVTFAQNGKRLLLQPPLIDVKGYITRAALTAARAQGYTTALNFLERTHWRCARLCSDVAEIANDSRAGGKWVYGRVYANAYLTPAGTEGLGLHHDAEDVIVFQLSGTKTWSVFEPVTDRPVTGGDSYRMADLVSAAEHVMQPGDVMVLPRGSPHLARSTDEESLHVSVTVRDVQVRHVLGALSRMDHEELAAAVSTEDVTRFVATRTGPIADALDRLLRSNVDVVRQIRDEAKREQP